MKKYLRAGACALLGMTLFFGVTSCGDDDPDYSNVTPPTVAQVHNISGSVAGMDGKGIEGATVTMGGTMSSVVKTDANGYFVFENVKVGTYSLKVTAEGKLPKETSVSVADGTHGQNVVWNVMLPSEESVTDIKVTVSGGGEGNVTTEALEGNDKAEIPVEVAISPSTLSVDATVEVSPIYTVGEAALPRVTMPSMAPESGTDGLTMVVGARISCSDSEARIEKPIDITFDLDEATAAAVRAKKYSNGAWVDVPSRVEGGKVVVSADEFTSYGLFLAITFTTTGRNETVKFGQSVWDNLYGNAPMQVGSAAYTYKVGMDVNPSGDTVFTALLLEALVRTYGANSYETQGNYPLNVTLPIGTKLEISGVQRVNTVTASSAGRSVSGTQYGDVTITVKTSNRDHTGGSSTGGSN